MNIDYDRLRELADTASPGPYDSHRICTESGVYMGIMHGQVAALAAAAPDLAETIAAMHYEYAVQIRRGSASPWVWVKSGGHFSKRGSTSVWCKKIQGCESTIRAAFNRRDVDADTTEFRIMRRLVSAPEVME